MKAHTLTSRFLFNTFHPQPATQNMKNIFWVPNASQVG